MEKLNGRRFCLADMETGGNIRSSRTSLLPVMAAPDTPRGLGGPKKAPQPADGEGGAAAADSAAAKPRGRPRRPPPVPEEAAVSARLLKVVAPCLCNMCRTILPNNQPPVGLPLARQRKQSLVEMLMPHHERLAAVFTSDAPATAPATQPLPEALPPPPPPPLPSPETAPPATAPPSIMPPM